MEALLCDEDWLSSPAEAHIGLHHEKKHGGSAESLMSSVCVTANDEDNEQAVSVCLEKEMSYMPESHYKEFLESKNLVFVRLRCIQWLIKCRIRWSLSHGTVFLAANYLDRFISKNRCKEWKNWMVELLAVACLSVACKFHESYPPTLTEIQMEEMDHVFDGSSIERMEMILLKVLEWRLCSPTPYSYIQLLESMELEAEVGGKFLMPNITQLLLGAVLDYNLVDFRPSLLAVSAVWCCPDYFLPPITSQTRLSYITRMFNQHPEDEMMKCREVMQAARSSHCPRSPTSVLMNERSC
ncbi:putative cyclin-D7-1 [Momordica charantia]|uniref:B-like cyclin n=1 Tax=Momordica charantia TaxID=3673 RepID=A0A6J1CRV7_MOMCH|nr:putative cyclin-D7-1 [Momordica charantia]